ncbi:MAG: glycerophosphodiester phosphodiesterase [Proteobacteria bacterium]|nr:glycerophosphodiester phosphodiesterase [Pseudomonadota bacterium]
MSMRAAIWALPALALFVACSEPEEPEPEEPPHPWEGHPLFAEHFFNVAHRGGGVDHPEMTMVAFENAIDVGADMLEIDVHMTTDGVLILMHDDSVDRTTDGTGAIKNMSWTELSALDAGYQYTEDGGTTFPFRGQGVTIPRLDDVLDAFSDKTFSIEVKQSDPPLVDELIAMLDDKGVAEQVVVSSFEDGPIAALREERADILTGLTTTEALGLYYLDDSDFDEYIPPTYYFAAPFQFGGLSLDQETVDKAHHFGLTVHVWTVNDEADMQTVLDFGADGLITDDPELLDTLLGSAGI